MSSCIFSLIELADIQTIAFQAASGEKYPLNDIEELLIRIERSGEVNPIKGDIPDIDWPSEELREMSCYTPPTVEEYPHDTKPDVYQSNILENYDAILPDISPPKRKKPKVKEKSAPAQTLAFQPTDVYDRFLFNTREQVILLRHLIIYSFYLDICRYIHVSTGNDRFS